MTAHPIDRDRLRKLAESATEGPWMHDRDQGDGWMVVFGGNEYPHGYSVIGSNEYLDPADAEFIAAARTALPALLDALAAAEHRATRAEAKAAIRGRAVAIHRERAKDAEGWAALWKETARHHIEGERFADAHIDKWRQWGERLHETHMAEVRDREARIKAVQALVDQADETGDWTVTATAMQWAIDGTVPPPAE